MRMPALTRANVRHIGALLRRGRNPAATVYDSIGSDFFLEPAPGWLNLGLWEGPGDESEAPRAVRRLVETLAGQLAAGAQDPQGFGEEPRSRREVEGGLDADHPVDACTPNRERDGVTEHRVGAGRPQPGAPCSQL